MPPPWSDNCECPSGELTGKASNRTESSEEDTKPEDARWSPNEVHQVIRRHIRSGTESEGTMNSVFTGLNNKVNHWKDLEQKSTWRLWHTLELQVHTMEEELIHLICENGSVEAIELAMHEAHIAHMALHSNNCIQAAGLTGDARGNLPGEDPSVGPSIGMWPML